MVDEQPRLQVLTVVGEVQAEQLGVAAGCAEPHVAGHPHHVAAERDRDMTEHGVFAQPGVVCADMHGVVGPVGDPDHREPRRIVDDEFDVVGIDSAAAMVDDDDRFGKLLDAYLQVSVGHGARTGSFDRDLYRLGDLRVAGDGDDRRGVERRKGLCGNPVGGYAALPESLVAATHRLHLHTGLLADRDLRGSGGVRRTVVQAVQTS